MQFAERLLYLDGLIAQRTTPKDDENPRIGFNFKPLEVMLLFACHMLMI